MNQFVLREEETFDWNVKAMVPMQGKRRAVQFMATFNILDQEVIDELVGNPETRDYSKFLDKALVSFDLPVQDADGKDVTDKDERRDIIKRKGIFVEALLEAYAAGALSYKAKN